MSNYISKNLKKNFQNYKRKRNVSLTVYHEKYTGKLEDFLVDNKPKYFDESEVEVLPKTQCRCSIEIFGKYLTQ